MKCGGFDRFSVGRTGATLLLMARVYYNSPIKMTKDNNFKRATRTSRFKYNNLKLQYATINHIKLQFDSVKSQLLNVMKFTYTRAEIVPQVGPV
jgi:hypothetical protein